MVKVEGAMPAPTTPRNTRTLASTSTLVLGGLSPTAPSPTLKVTMGATDEAGESIDDASFDKLDMPFETLVTTWMEQDTTHGDEIIENVRAWFERRKALDDILLLDPDMSEAVAKVNGLRSQLTEREPQRHALLSDIKSRTDQYQKAIDFMMSQQRERVQKTNPEMPVEQCELFKTNIRKIEKWYGEKMDVCKSDLDDFDSVTQKLYDEIYGIFETVICNIVDEQTLKDQVQEAPPADPAGTTMLDVDPALMEEVASVLEVGQYVMSHSCTCMCICMHIYM